MKRIVSIICLAALLVSVLSMTAFAEGNESYSFNKGKSENESRHAIYSQLGHTEEQVDKSGYVDSHVNSDAAIATLNTDALVDAGIIDQATADKIAAFAATKHTNIEKIYFPSADKKYVSGFPFAVLFVPVFIPKEYPVPYPR